MPVDLALLAAAVHERARGADTSVGRRGRHTIERQSAAQFNSLAASSPAPHLRPRIDPRTSTVLRWPVPGWRLAVPVTVPRGWRHSHFAPMEPRHLLLISYC
jgi:hypothetical protein